MNLYIRYFDFEVLATSFDQAFDFLYSIDEIEMNEKIENDVREYMHSDMMFPKRYKVRPRIYFIMIKTSATSMEEFKRNNKKNAAIQQQPAATEASAQQDTSRAQQRSMQNNILLQHLYEEKPGWYEGCVDFKRVIVSPTTGKCIYKDTHFVARCKAASPAECYERIIDHLTQRVDHRSQFPSIKGKNFQYKYLGTESLLQ